MAGPERENLGAGGSWKSASWGGRSLADVTTARRILEGLTCGDRGCRCAASARRGWGSTHCPAHDDEHPSLSIHEGPDGRPRVYCHGGCSQEAVVAALRRDGVWFESPAPRKRRAGRGGRIVAVYDYTSASGTLLYQVLRWEPKGFSQRRPDGNGGWIDSLDGVPRVLYHLPDVRAAVQRGDPVYVVEGEKDADALRPLACARPRTRGALASGVPNTARPCAAPVW